MVDQTPRPAAPSEPNRAGNIEGFDDAFNSPDSNASGQDRGAKAPERGADFQTRTRDVNEPFAELAAALANKLATAAVERDGPAALVCTRRSTALHEAGHCVICALDGTLPTSTRIWPIRHDGGIEWLGRTEGIPGGRVDEQSSAAADVIIARSLLAGVVAEKMFDPDARSGSSTHEIASALGVNKMIAVKTNRQPVAVWEVILGDIFDGLHAHQDVVFAIAEELMRRQCISKSRLKRLLRPIRRTK
jgi:hypothetical protein